MFIREHRAFVVGEFVERLKNKMCSTRSSMPNINSRQDLMDVCMVTACEEEAYAEFTQVLDDLGISDSNIPSIIGMFSQSEFMDEFQHAFADFVVTIIEKG